MLKSCGVVAHVILVSAQGPNLSFFFFWGTSIRLGGLFWLGLGLGPGLDNFQFVWSLTFIRTCRTFSVWACPFQLKICLVVWDDRRTQERLMKRGKSWSGLHVGYMTYSHTAFYRDFYRNYYLIVFCAFVEFEVTDWFHKLLLRHFLQFLCFQWV